MLSVDTLDSWFVYRNRLLSQPNRTRVFPVQCNMAKWLQTADASAERSIQEAFTENHEKCIQLFGECAMEQEKRTRIQTGNVFYHTF